MLSLSSRRLQGAVHLILGPVGAGKSTFSQTLGERHQAVRLILDDWMAQLFGADERPAADRIGWYMERRDRCLEQIWKVTSDLCEIGTNVVLEVGLIQRADREVFYRRIEDAEHPLVVYVVDAPRDVRRERVMRRNEEKGPTFAQVVPLEFFELASNMWQPPDDDEVRVRGIHFV